MCGGKTARSPCLFSRQTVHPHAGGENLTGLHERGEVFGSPPRVWGKPSTWVQKGIRGRFTPTRVGKTNTSIISICYLSVHPHVGGENDAGPLNVVSTLGSPPRVWGKPLTTGAQVVYKRFTPTRVGKTFAASPCFAGHSVHPHACGENPTGGATTITSAGSPPRGWGKHFFYNKFAFRSHF